MTPQNRFKRGPVRTDEAFFRRLPQTSFVSQKKFITKFLPSLIQRIQSRIRPISRTPSSQRKFKPGQTSFAFPDKCLTVLQQLWRHQQQQKFYNFTAAVATTFLQSVVFRSRRK